MSEEIEAQAPTFNPRDENVLKEKRARGIVAMGNVLRDGNGFRVKSPSLKVKAFYEVRRDGKGKVTCTCADFESGKAADPKYRCEHILAVKFAILSHADLSQFKNFETAFRHDEVKTKEDKMSKQSAAAKKAGAPEVNEIQESDSVVPFTDTLRALKQQIDPNLVKTREGWTDRQGNVHRVEFIEWHTCADILDRVAPAWSHAVRNVVQIGDTAVVTAAITIDGITREGVGTGKAESEMGIKKAEHDALKRAAVKFGIARELYQRESEVIERQDSSQGQNSFPRDPLAKSMADLVTPKQLGMIRALAREAGVNPDEECQTVLRCKTDELSKRAASALIDHLKTLQQEAGSVRRAS